MSTVFSKKWMSGLGLGLFIAAQSSSAAALQGQPMSQVPTRQVVPTQRTTTQTRPALTQAPVASAQVFRSPASSHDISEAIDITGQSRNLSMGLMFQRDQDKVSFGLPRTNYKDKISGSQINY